MASVPWSPPWGLSNRTEVLSPEQIERILQMHKESKQNAVVYVLVVLAVYFVALAILVGRYLHYERDHDVIMCIGQALERCVGSCRRDAAPCDASRDVAKEGPPPGAAALPVTLTEPGEARAVPLTLLRLPRIKRPPQTDSSDCSSTGSRGSVNASESSSGLSRCSGSNGCLAPKCESTPLDTMNMDRRGCPGEGHLSPAVVSVMVCDLQDTQV